MKLKNKLKVGFLFIGLLFLLGPVNTQAVETETVSIMPAYPDPAVGASSSWFLYTLNPKEEKMDAVKISNSKDETVVVKLSAVDAMNASDGAFSVVTDEDTQLGIGKWVTLMTTEVELAPKESKIVPFKISLPDNVDVGSHMGGIMMQEINLAESTDVGGMKLNIITRIGARIYLTVPGEVIKDYEITRFDWGYAAASPNIFKQLVDLNKSTVFHIGMKNNGNVLINPRASVEITNMLGKQVANLPDKELGGVFPKSSVSDMSVVWDKMPFLGRYKVTLKLDSLGDGSKIDTRELVIWTFPNKLAFLLIITFVLLFLVNLIRKFFGEASKEKMPIYVVKPGETLATIARKYNVNWKKLAKINYLTKPYNVSAGKKLFIPVRRKTKEVIKEARTKGDLMSPLKEQANFRSSKRRYVFVGILVLAAAGGSIWFIKAKSINKIITENLGDGQKAEEKVETPERTKYGAIKKSGVNVALYTPGNGDSESSQRILKKFQLSGYSISLGTQAAAETYSKTVIEYRPDKKEQAEMVKNDLACSQDIELKENPNLSSDVLIYNLAPKSDFLEPIAMR